MDKYLQNHDWNQAFTLNCQLHHLHSLPRCVIMKYFMAEREREGEREQRRVSGRAKEKEQNTEL